MIDDVTARSLAILITAIGGPTLLISLGRSIFKWYTGRSGRERQRNRDLIDDIRSAEDRADDEAISKRKALEYASELRRQLNEAGVTPLPWPINTDRSSTQPRKTKTRREPKE